jgi:hypothetical protein
VASAPALKPRLHLVHESDLLGSSCHYRKPSICPASRGLEEVDVPSRHATGAQRLLLTTCQDVTLSAAWPPTAISTNESKISGRMRTRVVTGLAQSSLTFELSGGRPLGPARR